MKADMKVDTARVTDAASMHRLINYFADKGEMLSRALSEMDEGIRDYFVVREREQPIAWVALHVPWGDLAEIRSPAADKKEQNHRIGSALVEACVKEAKELRIPKVSVLLAGLIFSRTLALS